EGQFVREGGFNKPWSMYLNQKLDVKAPFRDCPTLSYFFVTLSKLLTLQVKQIVLFTKALILIK
ncbi:MAG: hypothetical protein AB4368_25530, partial [Xenococcaceae cyanobacterium]